MTKSELVTTRDYLPEDKNFIYSTWLRGMYYGESWFSIIKKQVFMENYHKIIDYILDKESTKIRVSCLKDDPSVILGYAVLSPTAIHWVFVKKSWRGIGIAKDLVPPTIKTITQINKTGLGIMKKKDLEFNPFETILGD